MAKKLFDGNGIMHGSGGHAWWNGKKLALLQSVEAKVSGDFEDIEQCGDNATYSIYNGYSGDGTITLIKTNSNILTELAEAYQTGIMPDITIVTALKQRGTNKVERVAFTDIVITEIMLTKFEKKTKVEQEIPFKFGNFEVLESA